MVPPLARAASLARFRRLGESPIARLVFLFWLALVRDITHLLTLVRDITLVFFLFW